MRRTLGALSIAAGLAVHAPAAAQNVEDIIGQHMVAQALLAAHVVALAERVGMSREEIVAILSDVADRSAVDEFWITDEAGHAYLTNTGIDFSFSPDPAEEPQAFVFWPLLEGEVDVVVQHAQQREVDDQVYKYVGVAGVDKPRIVQVGVSEEHLRMRNGLSGGPRAATPRRRPARGR